MNFDDTPEEAAFRSVAHQWISANAPRHLLPQLERAPFGNLRLEGVDAIAASKEWQRRKKDAGWACLTWPVEYGGRNAAPIEELIWRQEEGAYGILSNLFMTAKDYVAPTLMEWGTQEQRARLLPPIAAGDEVWCQLFSEPSGGSDLAGVRTKAQKDGSDWIVNGQKIWTSGAKDADWGILILRTDPNVVKHRGLTMFYLNVRSPGVDIRPIKQVNGHTHFNEVFLTDVRIPDSQRIGPIGDGWQVALTVLSFERLVVGELMSTGFSELFDLARSTEWSGGLAIDDPAVRSKLASFAVRDAGLRNTVSRIKTAISQKQQPGPESFILKLVAGSTMQEIATYALDMQGQFGAISDDPNPDHGRFQIMLLRSAATRIEGGTDEILRNVIADRILMLPSEPRVDKDVPFNQIPKR